MKSDDRLATILLVSRVCAGGLSPLKASEYWTLLDRLPDQSPSALLGVDDPEALADDLGLPHDVSSRIHELVDRSLTMAFELDRLEQSGISTITHWDSHYPPLWNERLGSKAPPVIHAAGSIDLLGIPGLGVVGSRDVSEAGAKVAREIGALAAKRSLPLVSGGARGVDQLAMDAAFESGGTVVGILAESLARKLKRPDVRHAIHDGATVLCTPYNPDAPFSAGNAMGRNKLIYAHTQLTVVIASAQGSGGTWSGATEALRHGYSPVAVWRGEGEGPGNSALQAKGATGVSSLADIEALLDTPDPQNTPAGTAGSPNSAVRPEQLSLLAASSA